MNTTPHQKITAFPDQCRLSGLRVTRPRLLIYKALVMNPDHPSLKQVCQQAQPQLPQMALSTVYNVLEQLTEHGLIRKVPSHNQEVRYDANTFPHHHLVCTKCDSITDITLERALSPTLPKAITDFTVIRTEVNFYGLCRGCQQPAA